MKRLVLAAAAAALLAVPSSLPAATGYRLPPPDVVRILDAPGAPQARLSPAGDAALLVEIEPNPPLAVVAEPFLRLAGVRIVPARGAQQHLSYASGLSVLSLPEGRKTRVTVPRGARLGMPVFSPDGGAFAFVRDADDRTELWLGETKSGAVAVVPGVRVNDVAGEALRFSNDSRTLWVLAVPADRKPAPAEPGVPEGPVVEETAGKKAQPATYQDLLKSPHDEDLFEHYATSQVVKVDVASRRASPFGLPGLFTRADPSPDGRYLLVARMKRPFSYHVPYRDFPHALEVWDAGGRVARVVADLPLADETPRQGVPTGPRHVEWQPVEDASLFWTEALDGGDPMRKVPFRESLRTLRAPFAGEPREVRQLVHRLQGVEWTVTPGTAIVHEYDRARRWRTTSEVDLDNAAVPPRVLFDLSAQDAYKDPGRFVTGTSRRGRRTIVQEGVVAFLSGEGATPDGMQPFLDAVDLSTGQTRRLFRSSEDALERFVGFVGESRSKILVRRETPSEPPNLWLVDLAQKQRAKLTDFKDPAPELAGVKKEILKYTRADGVPLSGTLYLPAGAEPGKRLPCLVWAYPLEYSDAATAGQVRASPNAFTRPTGASPLFFLTQGWAVLMDATMPVVGDPEKMNDTYVDQITGAAKAAIDALDAGGVVDRTKVVVGGHSYGAFMTANLLAHSDLFAAGIARSGAYNRTLTPFGFQSERRSLWEAPETYLRVSPFMAADRIKTPLLLIHGEADNNSGTFPIQSERLYAAIQGTGGTARLVLLPFEAHGYRGRESVLHTLAEMLEWGKRWTDARGGVGPGSGGK
jgi:dipeptidyl aminopeptidase/acylaminoacyl peptidase